jgi:hypothetical protein
MESAVGTAGFAKRYADFMQAAANHVTVFQPFLALVMDGCSRCLGPD